jgi:drug/metabolite transporter (DMT)-like permease
MNLHTVSGRWQLGLALSIVTTVLWGLLPIALKGLLDQMSAYTIIWYRLFVSASFLFVFITYRHGFPSPRGLLKTPVTYMLVICGLGLCGNYILYILGLDLITPSATTIVIQLSSVFLLLGSLIFFKERFSAIQWIGFIVLLAGMGLFFNNRIDDLLYRITNHTIGVLLVMAAGASWAIYALTQKQLLNSYPSEKIMLFIYVTGVLVFLPFAEPSSILQLDAPGLLLLVFCSFNTLFAYGCFAEALDHWESSRVVMVTSATPIITVGGMGLCAIIFPGFMSAEHLNSLSIAGTFLVIAGSMMSSLSGSRRLK